MKLELKRQDFLKAWQIAERFVDSKTAKEAIGGILISAGEDNTVRLEATDLKTSVRCRAEGVNVIEQGQAVVPAMILGSMIKKSAADDLMLEVNAERGFLNAGNSKTRFAVFTVEEFPKIPESASADNICEIAASELARAIVEGGSSASQPTDFPRYIGACMLRAGDGCLRGISTDGKRLSLSKVLCETITKDEDLLLPAQALKDFGKTLSSSYDGSATVKILADDSTVWFGLEGVEFSIRRVDATFPIYERILNNVVKTSLDIDNATLASVLERIDIIAKTTTAHIMSMTLNPAGSLKIMARAPEKGTASEELEASVGGEYMQIGFNVAYFLDGLKVLGPGNVHIEFSDEEGQTRMKRAGHEEEFLYMLMPARLSPQDRAAEDEMGEFYSQADPDDDDEEDQDGNADENNGENFQQ